MGYDTGFVIRNVFELDRVRDVAQRPDASHPCSTVLVGLEVARFVDGVAVSGQVELIAVGNASGGYEYGVDA